MSDSRDTEAERFWSKVDQTGDRCWEWQACLRVSGYGHAWFRGKTAAAHRVAYTLIHGAIPEGMMICHHCDNRRCVRPSHLYAGNRADNVRDAVERNRVHRGERSPQTRLSANQVLRIRAMYAEGEALMTEIARRFGVSKGAVKDIVDGRNWAHLTGGEPLMKGQRRVGKATTPPWSAPQLSGSRPL